MLQLYRNIFDEEFLLRSRPSSFSRFRCFRSAAARGETNSAAMHRNATVKSKVDDASPAAAAAPMSFSQSSAESQSVWTCARSHEIRKIFFGIMRSFLASLVFLGFTSYSGIRGQEVTVPHRFRTSYQNGHDTVRFLSKKFVSSKKWKIFVLKRVAIICRLQIRLWFVPLCVYCIIENRNLSWSGCTLPPKIFDGLKNIIFNCFNPWKILEDSFHLLLYDSIKWL